MKKGNKSRRGLKIDVPENQLHPIAASILAELREGKKTKKELANIYGVDYSLVVRIAIRFNTGVSNREEEEKDTMEEVKKEKEQIVEETSIEKVNETKESKPRLGGKPKLDDDLIMAMLEDAETGNFSLQELANKFNISTASVSRYCSKFGITSLKDGRSSSGKKVEKKQAQKSKPKQQKQKIKDQDSTQKKEPTNNTATIITNKRRVKMFCGLIKDRHDMPNNVQNYIYNRAVPEELMFDYEQMENVIVEFMKNNVISRNPLTGKEEVGYDLYIYTTGLTCAVAAVVKVCYVLGVNLSMMHYNYNSRDYKEQKIWGGFGKNELFGKFAEFAPDKIIIPCGQDNIDLDSQLYIIKTHDNSSNYVEIFLFNSDKDAWTEYGNILPSIMMNPNNVSVSLYKSRIDNGRLQSVQMAKSQNR